MVDELHRARRPRRLRRARRCSASGWPTRCARAAPRSCASRPSGAARSRPSGCSTPRASRARALFVVHGETSTGVAQPLDGLAEACRDHDALLLVDCVTSLAGHPLDLDAAGVDAAFSGTQKCLNCPPGPRAVHRGRARDATRIDDGRARSWYFDLERSSSATGTPTAAAAPTTTPRRSTWSTRCARRCGSCTRRASRRAGSATPTRARARCATRSPCSASSASRPRASSCTRCSRVRLPEGIDEAARPRRAADASTASRSAGGARPARRAGCGGSA